MVWYGHFIILARTQMHHTDHALLKASLTAKYSSGRRAHWSETMAEFNRSLAERITMQMPFLGPR